MSNLIVVLGSCMIDFVCYAPRLPKCGETLKGDAFTTNQGGKGGNQCMAAAKLGGKTALIARLGYDQYGKDYLNILEKYNINTEYTLCSPTHHSGIAQIMVDKNKGDNSIIIVPGANDTMKIDDLNKVEHLLNTAKILVCQLEIPVDVTLNALKQFTGISILNGAPAIDNINCDLLKYASIFCVNETETSTICGLSCNTINEAKVAVQKLIEMGCNIVILTLGDKGALIGSKNKDISHIETDVVKAVDTTGAGDCFVGALAFLLAEYEQLTIENQVQLACKLASYSVQFNGTHTAFPDNNILKQYITAIY